MLLYHDIPASQGVENALRRAKQMAQVEFTPVKRLPIVEKVTNADGTRVNVESHAAAYFPLRGMIYSSVRKNEKYLGFNVSLETFITAVSNPNSVVYTRPIEGTGQNVHNYYGIVCSCFASYTHDLHYRTPCAYWPKLPGVTEVDAAALENLRLCDVVLNVKKHIAVITDIERDIEGKVHYITVSESVLPRVRVTRFTPEQFRGYWLEDNYRIFRNANIDSVTYTPSPFVHVDGDPVLPEAFVNDRLMPDYGNRANYILGDEPVELTVYSEKDREVEVIAPDGSARVYAAENGRVTVKPGQTGFYRAHCRCGEDVSADVEWCVTDLQLSLDRDEYDFGEEVRVKFSNPAGDGVLAWQFTRDDNDRGCGCGFISNIPAGEMSVKAPTASGKMTLIVVAKNAFGEYSSRRIPLTVREKQEQ